MSLTYYPGVPGPVVRPLTGLSVPAPPAVNAFTLAFVTGDNITAGQAFAPAGWTTIPSVTASNGTDDTCDVVLTAAWTVTSSAVSVTGTATSAEDLSGSIIGVQVDAESPIPAVSGVAPGWAGRTILEAALGAGFGTPPDQLTWTVLNDSAVPPSGQVKRFWGWSDSGGVPYRLGQLQSGNGGTQLDNADGELTPSNAASEWYPNVTTGTPIRLRTALGTVGGVPVDRWYVIAKNFLQMDEKRDETLRNYLDVATTDIWSVVGGSCPSPYRGEIAADSPYAWWPCDDQLGRGGILPSFLLNAAAGNSNNLQILLSPNGATIQPAYTTSGINNGLESSIDACAVFAVGQQQGWMYGDPASSPGSSATGNPVTASPGSAAWQQTTAYGGTGANGWYLACNDTNFPPLSGGVTVEGWASYAYFGTANGYEATGGTSGPEDFAGQPYCPLTVLELATGSAPVAILQLDLAGHLNLITYNGGTGTSHSIYSGTDLRTNTFFSATLELTQTTWTVLVNGGATAAVSGTATGMTSAWTWLLANADMGAGGGGTTSGIGHGGNCALSHLAVYAGLLPRWRAMAHYWAAVTGFGLLPVPSKPAIAVISNGPVTGGGTINYSPDGSIAGGNYGLTGAPLSPVTSVALTAVIAAFAGPVTSGPSAWGQGILTGQPGGGSPYGQGGFLTWTGLAAEYGVYTADQVATETGAAVTLAQSVAMVQGYGATASADGSGLVSSASGAAVPSGPTPVADPAGARLERILGYGLLSYPNRAIDPAPLPVQAALDVGGQQTGANIQNIVNSDNGLLSVDNCGTICYRQKSHLASDAPIWNLSSAGPQYGLPFKPDQVFTQDPQRVVNVIQIQPYSPDGSTPPVITPSDAAAVNASVAQYGPRPAGWSSSYLQSTAEIQDAVDWLIAQFGTASRRVKSLTVDAAGLPAAWVFFYGANNGDLCQVVDQPLQGGPLSAGIYRISSISRRTYFGANQSKPEASITIVAEPEPSSYWS